MNEVVFIMLSGLLLAVPVTVKYLLAFQTRALVLALKSREREVQHLVAQLQAIEQETRVMGRAVRNVALQRQHAHARRSTLSDRLDYVRRLGAQADAETVAVPASR
jgi:hypothetical protein